LPATIKDVSKYAAVSVGSVSRYLNGYNNCKSTTKAAIENAIEELGYKRNFIARGLKTNRTMTVGIVVPVLDSFSAGILSPAQRVLDEHQYNIIFYDYGGSSANLSVKLQQLLEKRIDGVILGYSGKSLPILQKFLDQKIPVVVVNEDIADFVTDKVFVDNERAGYGATAVLLNAKHRNIGIIGGHENDDYTGAKRLGGYMGALKEHNIEPMVSLIAYGHYDYRLSYEATKRLMAHTPRPTALFATSYHATLGMMIALNEMGVRIPDELSVVGFDKFDFLDVIRPKLTLVEQPCEQIGRVAAEILLRRMRGDYADFPACEIVNTRLIHGKSVAPPCI